MRTGLTAAASTGGARRWRSVSEWQKCLVKLAAGGDIPPEVLLSLPSPEEIGRRAEEAKAKAQAALAYRALRSANGAPGLLFPDLHQ